MTATLLIPALNEIVGLQRIAPRIKREWFDQIMLLDGGSTDGTVEYAEALGWEVLHQQSRGGVRMALVEAYPHVRGDLIVTFSPDGNCIPELLPEALAAIRDGRDDMVIVSRYAEGAQSYDDTKVTRLGNWVFTTMINWLFGGRYTDALSMFRVYRRAVPALLGLTRQRSERWERLVGRYISWEPQLSMRCARQGFQVREIPGDEPRRVEDEMDAQPTILPSTRIFHFRCGLMLLYQILVHEAWRGRRWLGRALAVLLLLGVPTVGQAQVPQCEDRLQETAIYADAVARSRTRAEMDAAKTISELLKQRDALQKALDEARKAREGQK